MIGRFPTAWITLFCAFVAIILPYSAGLHCCMNDKCEPGPRDECGNNNTITTCGWEPGSAGSFSYSCQTHYSTEKRRFPAYCQPTDEKCECTTEYCNNKFHTPTQAPAPALPPGPLSAPNPPPPATKSASANPAIPNEVLAAVVIFLCASGSKFNSGYGGNGATGGKVNGKESHAGGNGPRFFKTQRPSATKAVEGRNGHGNSGASSSSNGFGDNGRDFGSQNGLHGGTGNGGASAGSASGYGSSGQQYSQNGGASGPYNPNGGNSGASGPYNQNGGNSGTSGHHNSQNGGNSGAASGHQHTASQNGGHESSSGHHHSSSGSNGQNGAYTGASSSPTTSPYRSSAIGPNPLTSNFRVLPDANGECPLTCPPCASCDHPSKGLHKTPEDLLILRPRRSYDDPDTSASLEVKLGTCNARRDRTVNPPGIHISFTVVVSFHENFITKVDKAYHISCSYEEVDRTVSTQIDVSAPPEVNLEGVIEPPQCRYRISRPNGDPVRDVNVGTPIEHRWECSSPNGYDRIHEIYGLLVHNCYVEDGRGRRELVIDDKGCSVQPLVIGTPVYSETSMSATIQSLVVKFPDRDTLDFQCSFYSCLKADGGCQAVTPPKCDGTRARRSADSNETLTPLLDEWKLHAPRLHVMDIDADIKQSDIDELQALVSMPPQRLIQNRLEELCVSVVSFGLIIASSTFLLTVSLVILTGLAFFRAAPKIGKEMSYRI